MAKLNFSPIFQEITYTFRDEMFSAMYFGRHCGKNLLILKHDLSIMLAFENNQWSNPDLIKSITLRGDPVKGVQVVGSEDVILMLDELGNLWSLTNAFDISTEKFESLHSLDNKCFYEWAPFQKFNFEKVLAICALKQGFVCIGLKSNLEKKLAMVNLLDLPVEEFTFDGLSATNSFNYYIINLDIKVENSILKSKLNSTEEVLLVTDRFKGRTYLCTKDGKNCLINQSNIHLIAALHYKQEKCIILCLQSGKLIIYFYDDPDRQCIVHLPKKLVAVEKCCCFNFCLLWSDGINLHHTKLSIDCSDSLVKASHLKLFSAIQSPLSLLLADKSVLAVTTNSIYYFINASSEQAVKIKKHPKQLLNDINECSLNIDQLELNIDMLSHYLFCKDIIGSSKKEEKIIIKWEENHLVVKNCLGVCLRHEFWKLRLKTLMNNKEVIHTIDFKFDLSDGMCITIDNPFKNKCKLKASVIGSFGNESIFLDLGEVDETEGGFRKNRLSKHLENILIKRNPDYAKNKFSI